MKRVLWVSIMLLLTAGTLWAAGVKKKKPLPYEFGSVTINNYSPNRVGEGEGAVVHGALLSARVAPLFRRQCHGSR